ncbi:hypothetical protein M407DRAFT_32406 [Tulasnella calospora MUT 4182]|uniref:Cytoplasmic protein n=1 Tax=Tulasnella calospora MUT 4182 TaxID=1051891 RepID=A0A0C3PT30_9AGAM|nr:hypothetical protein M407DRAFT_32406 [Tulasnella calospora MUT 4182]
MSSNLEGLDYPTEDLDTTPANLLKPTTSATITIRVIKSFEFRTTKSMVLHDLNLEQTTVGQLKDLVRQAIKTQGAWKPYRNVELDTIKLYTTTNLIINLENDETMVWSDDSATLATLGAENETEVSIFNKKIYDEFKQKPETKWD